MSDQLQRSRLLRRPAPAPAGAGPAATFLHGTVLPNLRAGVAAVLGRPARAAGIDEVDDDPCYENLYDRAYALLSDGAELEHLAVAAVTEPGDALERAGAARLAVLVRAWAAEADRPAGYGNAYASTRLLKGLAVGFDTFRHALEPAERLAVEEALVRFASNLWAGWFARPPARGPIGVAPGLHSPHHSCVEWSAFGVTALALLDSRPDARTWLDATVEQFETRLLPGALAEDGAPPEGWAFWVSTMFSRVQFLDALATRTGTDLAAGCTGGLATTLARALVRTVPPLAASEEGEDRLDLDAHPLLLRGAGTVLCWLAARSDDAALQGLALLDGRAGALESASFATPRRRIRLRLPTSSYAALWLRADLAPAAATDDGPRTFPSVALAVDPHGWRRVGGHGRFAAAIEDGRVVLWAGDALVYQDLVPVRTSDLEASRAAGTGIHRFEPADLHGSTVAARRAPGRDRIEARDATGRLVARVTIAADGTRADVERRLAADHRWRTSLDLRPASGAGRWSLAGADGRVEVACGGCRLVAGAPADRTMRVGYDLLALSCDPPVTPLFDHRAVADDPAPSLCSLAFVVAGGPSDEVAA